MADVTPILINQLTSQTTLQDTDYFIVGGGDAKKITVARMKEALGINSLNTKISGIASKRIYNKNSATATPDSVATLRFDSEWEGYTAIGIGAFFIGNRSMSLYNLAMQQMQLQNISSTNQTVNVGAAYMDIIYIPD